MFKPVPDKHFIDYILCEAGDLSITVMSFPSTVNTSVIDKGASILKIRVKVLVSSEFGVKVQYRKIVYDVVPYIKPKKKSAAKTDGQKNVYRPPDEHYYKYGHVLWPKLSFDQSNQEILEMLMEIFFNKYA